MVANNIAERKNKGRKVPTTDGTYVLKATVLSGTATLSWVAE